MNLLELRDAVINAVDRAYECGVSPDAVVVSVQIDMDDGEAACSNGATELIYDNNLSTSGCVISGAGCVI